MGGGLRGGFVVFDGSASCDSRGGGKDEAGEEAEGELEEDGAEAEGAELRDAEIADDGGVYELLKWF